MTHKKLKLKKFDLLPLRDIEMRNILGGFVGATSGIATVSTGPSASVSLTNSVDTDSTNDVDADNDTTLVEKHDFLNWA